MLPSFSVHRRLSVCKLICLRQQNKNEKQMNEHQNIRRFGYAQFYPLKFSSSLSLSLFIYDFYCYCNRVLFLLLRIHFELQLLCLLWLLLSFATATAEEKWRKQENRQKVGWRNAVDVSQIGVFNSREKKTQQQLKVYLYSVEGVQFVWFSTSLTCTYGWCLNEHNNNRIATENHIHYI